MASADHQASRDGLHPMRTIDRMALSDDQLTALAISTARSDQVLADAIRSTPDPSPAAAELDDVALPTALANFAGVGPYDPGDPPSEQLLAVLHVDPAQRLSKTCTPSEVIALLAHGPAAGSDRGPCARPVR